MPKTSYTPDQFKPSAAQEIARWLYSAILAVIIPLFMLFFIVVTTFTRTKTYGRRFPERFGVLPKSNKTGGILLHCVSVGEVVAAEALVKTIRKQHPSMVFTITTTTPTGCERVQQLFGNDININHYYLPYDLSLCMNPLFKTVQPDKLLITEVELWPNFIHLAWKRRIPVFIVNARMTDSSCRAYGKIGTLFTPMLHKITGICAQGQRDYNNYLKLGAKKQQLVLTNNIKFDQKLTQNEAEQVSQWQQKLALNDRKVWLGGSTHDPEEQVLLDSYQALQVTFSNLLLILVPRHPNRFTKVESLIQKRQLRYIKTSDNKAVTADTQVVLADQIGILKSLYGVADVAFVGGSIATKGGHNALEPALHGVPVIMGSHIFNNPVICEALSDVGALQFVTTSGEIRAVVEPLLSSPENAKKRGVAGQQVIHKNGGAIAKTLEILAL